MRSRRKPLLSGGAMLVVVGVLAIGAGGAGATSSGRADSGTAWVANTPKPGALVYAAGFNHDKILGDGAVEYAITATSSSPGVYHLSTKHVTLFTPTGSLSGSATATLTQLANGSASVSEGKLMLTKGAGSQKGHSLTATFTGTGSIQKLAFTFRYKGTYSQRERRPTVRESPAWLIRMQARARVV